MCAPSQCRHCNTPFPWLVEFGLKHPSTLLWHSLNTECISSKNHLVKVVSSEEISLKGILAPTHSLVPHLSLKVTPHNWPEIPKGYLSGHSTNQGRRYSPSFSQCHYSMFHTSVMACHSRENVWVNWVSSKCSTEKDFLDSVLGIRLSSASSFDGLTFFCY